jgi:hypothetical protein
MDMKFSFKCIERYQWKIHLLNTDKICLLLLWLILPNILPFIISLFSQPIYLTRYTIVTSSAFYLLVASGVKNMNTNRIKLVITSIIIILSIQIMKYYTETKKEPWREVAKYVDTHTEEEDILLLNANHCREPFYYYSRNTILVTKVFPNEGHDVYENINELWKTIESYNRVWLMLCVPQSDDKKELIKNTLIKYYKLLYEKGYNNMDLYLFEKNVAVDPM